MIILAICSMVLMSLLASSAFVWAGARLGGLHRLADWMFAVTVGLAFAFLWSLIGIVRLV